MQYDSYQNKVKKVAAVLTKVYAVRIIIIIALAILVALAAAAVAAKGLIVTESDYPTQVVYGDLPTYRASAFWGDVTFEYRKQGNAEWSSEAPDDVGNYQMRAVSVSAFGNPRYGDIHDFTVAPRAISPVVTDTQITYGEAPRVEAATVGSDRISCGVLYEFKDGTAASIWVDPQTVTVTDAEGNDRTDCYIVVDTPKTDMIFTPRPLEITVQDADKVYDGVALTFDGYEISGGTLVEGDTLLAVFDDSLTIAGTLVNSPELRVMGADGTEVTRLYDMTILSGTLTVEQRPLIVETESSSFPYNGYEQTNPRFTVDPATPLVEGHFLAVESATGLLDCGSVENLLQLSVWDEAQHEQTENYAIFVKAGTLTVIPREITVYSDSETFVYDGDVHIRQSATADLPAGEYLYTSLYHATTIEDVGSVENVVVVQIFRGGVNITQNYNITYVYGTLTVVPRPIVVKIANASKVYDGIPLTSELYAAVIDPNAVYVTGDAIPYYPENMLRNGSLDYEVDSSMLPEDFRSPVEGHVLTLETEGSVLFGTGESRYVAGSARVYRDSGKTSGLATSVPINQRPDAVDVIQNYIITVLPGTLTVSPRPVTVAASDAQKVYDGEPLFQTAYEVQSSTQTPGDERVYDGLLNGHRLDAVTVGSQTDVGTSPNVIDLARTRILDTENGDADVTAYYVIICLDGTLEVTPCQIKVGTASSEWTYDGLPHSDAAMTVLEVLNGGKFVKGHTLVNLTDPLPTVTDVGQVSNVLEAAVTDGKGWVTHNYEITYDYGTLSVVPRPVTVRIPDKTWVYNGRAEEVTAGYTVDASSANTLVDGHWMIAARMDPPPTYGNVGTYVNNRPAAVYAGESGVDVTANYALTYVQGTVTIRPRPLVIQLDGEKYYDDTPLAGDDIKITYLGEYSLCEGHTLLVDPVATITDVGTLASYPNQKSLHILSGTEDVSKNYTVTYERGLFTVLPRPIGVRSYDAVKLYDGTPLTEPDGSVWDIEMPLVDGHILYVNAFGSGVRVGTYPNTVDPGRCRITNADGVDKTDNYNIVGVYEGTLTILAEPLSFTVDTGSDAKDYDGVPLECHEYSIGGDDVPAGFSIIVDHFASLAEPGRIENTAVFTIQDETGRTLSEELFDVEERFGTLTVYAPPSEPDSFTVGWVYTEHDGVLYLREDSYGDFNRQTWTETDNRYELTLPGGYGYQYLTSYALENLGLPLSEAQFKDMLYFMLPYYTQMGGPAPVVGSDTMNYEVWASDYSTGYIYTSNAADLVSLYMKLTEEERNRLAGEYAEEELAYRQHVYEEYLYVHPETRAFLQTIIDEQGFDPADPEVIAKVASYIQNAAVYNDDPVLAYEIEHTEDAVISFLRDYKEGLCRHYAASAAMMYRTLGIPARYTVGFMLEVKAGEWNEIATPGHAWVEVYLDGLGWVAVEVTGASSGGGSGGSGGGGDSGDSGDNGGSGGTGGDSVEKPRLVLTPVFQTKIYDGTPLTASQEIEITYELEKLLEQGYTYAVATAGSRLEVGESDVYVMSFTLYDPNGQDVTDSYEIETKLGCLKVTRSPVEVFLYPQDKTYDGQPAIWGSEDYEILSLTPGYSLQLAICIPLYEADVVTLSDLNRHTDTMATFAVFNAEGEDVTENYTLVFTQPAYMMNLPVLQIRTCVIELTAASEVGVYAEGGSALTNPDVYISRGKLLEGHTLKATAVGKQVGVGQSPNVVNPDSVVILDSLGNDVTRNYRPVFVDGLLTLIEVAG